MTEERIFSFDLPYRDPMEVQAFSFGIDDEGRALGKSAHPESFERTLCVVAGLRGNEVQQTLVCALLVDRLGRMERAKQLVPGRMITVIPCANPVSMGSGHRFWPGDKSDINRSFPGESTGETTSRIAAALFEQVRGYSYGIHLSSNYLYGDFLPHVRIMHGPGVKENHGADFGLPYVTHYLPGSLDTATLHYNWRLGGCEAYTFYTEETAVADEVAAGEAVRSLLRFTDARGITKPGLAGGYRSVELAERALVPVPVPTGGIWCPQARIGDVVERGQALGHVRDLLRGNVLVRLTSPCDGVVFYRAWTPLANEQTLAFQIAPPGADKGLDD